MMNNSAKKAGIRRFCHGLSSVRTLFLFFLEDSNLPITLCANGKVQGFPICEHTVFWPLLFCAHQQRAPALKQRSFVFFSCISKQTLLFI